MDYIDTAVPGGAEFRGLDSVRVTKDELLQAIRKNRDEHRLIFEEALEGWKSKVTKALEYAVADAKAGKDYRLTVGLVRPEDHTKDYDRAIRMLEMSQDDELVLSAVDFATYVMDEWGWQRTFAANTTLYSESARNKFNS